MEYIKSKLSDDLARKIIGSQEKATAYLWHLNEIKPIPSLKFKTISRGQNAGKKVLDIDTKKLLKAVVPLPKNGSKTISFFFVYLKIN